MFEPASEPPNLFAEPELFVPLPSSLLCCPALPLPLFVVPLLSAPLKSVSPLLPEVVEAPALDLASPPILLPSYTTRQATMRARDSRVSDGSDDE